MERKTVVGTGGELLVHQLLAQGVDYVFTNTGSAEAGFGASRKAPTTRAKASKSRSIENLQTPNHPLVPGPSYSMGVLSAGLATHAFPQP